MGHLSSTELIDVMEGVAPPDARQHAARCAACQDTLARLEQVQRLVAGVEVPDPSPLFWEHFSARVRETIAGEPRSGFAAAGGGWIGWRAARYALVAALAVGLVAVALDLGSRGGGPAGTNPVAPAVASIAVPGATPQAATGSVAPEDASLDLVADLSEDMNWDQTADAGMMVRAGSVDSAIARLSASERTALAKLLEAQLGHTSS
ncbi:MAG: hypothetical protein KGN76_06740 [Acidobacteriota bacterium]|nr:hypothetical protein [Acidobacteriota bacterium]